MLRPWQSRSGEHRLYIHYPALSAEAWIEPSRSLTSYPGVDWVVWYRVAPHRPACAYKSQLRLEIEGVLRGWLPRTYRCRLYDTRFRDLCTIAAGPRRHYHYSRARQLR